MVRPILLVAALLAALPAVEARAENARIEVLGREAIKAKVTGITKDAVVAVPAAGSPVTLSLDDLVSLSFAREVRTPTSFEPYQVELRFRNGDVLCGSIEKSKQDHVAVRSPIFGQVSFSVQDLSGIRFLDAWKKSVEKPSLAGVAPDLDLFYLRSLDHVEGVWQQSRTGGVVVQTGSGSSRTLDDKEMLEIRFAEAPAPPPASGRLAVVLFTDGSRLTARSITSDGKKLVLETVRKTDLTVPLEDVVSLYMKGGRFVYLSDLKPTETKIVPWIGKVYSWDRPRFDRSLLGHPLEAGGETWFKGIGVISGTTLTYDLSGGYSSFTSLIALDDTAGSEGDVVFEVLVDGKLRYKSETVKTLPSGKKPIRIPSIDLTGAKKLTLRVSFVDDTVKDFADWIDPMLLKAK